MSDLEKWKKFLEEMGIEYKESIAPNYIEIDQKHVRDFIVTENGIDIDIRFNSKGVFEGFYVWDRN